MMRETIGVLEIESHDAIQIYRQTLLRVQRHDSAVGFQPTEKPLRRVPAPTRVMRACRTNGLIRQALADAVCIFVWIFSARDAMIGRDPAKRKDVDQTQTKTATIARGRNSLRTLARPGGKHKGCYDEILRAGGVNIGRAGQRSVPYCCSALQSVDQLNERIDRQGHW
jgi:hypothetical protein